MLRYDVPLEVLKKLFATIGAQFLAQPLHANQKHANKKNVQIEILYLSVCKVGIL